MLKNLLNLLFASNTPKSSNQSRARKRKLSLKKKNGSERISEDAFAPTSSEGSGRPKVLIVDLGGDTSRDAADHIATCLDQFETCDIFRKKRVLKMGLLENLADKLATAVDEGRGWMAEEQADMLIWGEIRRGLLELRFIARVPSPENQPGAYGLGDVLVLPMAFSGAMVAALHVSVLSIVMPGYKGLRSAMGTALGKALEEVTPLLQEKPAEFEAGDYAALVTCIGNAFASYSVLGGPDTCLERALAAYKVGLGEISVQSDPVIWTVAQNHLAATLKVRGEQAKDAKILKQASAAYKAITDQLGRVEHPYDWAHANINMAMILYRLGLIASDQACYQDATKHFDEALTVYTKQKTPAKWADVCNQYGVVLLALGEEVTGNATLEIAINKFRDSLKIRKKELNPVLWAHTANNLGAACFSLAKRNSEIALLREAQSCFEGAVEIYTGAGATKKADVISNNLSRVQRLLATREGA